MCYCVIHFFLYTGCQYSLARSQESATGGYLEGLGAKLPVAGSWRQGGLNLEAEPPAIGDFAKVT